MHVGFNASALSCQRSSIQAVYVLEMLLCLACMSAMKHEERKRLTH